MAKEYIEREAAIKEAIAERNSHSPFTPELCGWRVGAEKVANRLASIHAADVVEIRHGQWIPKNADGSWRVDTCSLCKKDTHYIRYDPAYDFCPNCGADMREVDNGREEIY